MQTQPLGLSTMATAGRAPVADGEKVKCQCWETASSRATLQRPGSGTVPLRAPPHTEQQSGDTVAPLHDVLRLCPMQLHSRASLQYATYYDTESKQLYLIHKNKHRQAAKLRRYRNKEQNSRERTK